MFKKLILFFSFSFVCVGNVSASFGPDFTSSGWGIYNCRSLEELGAVVELNNIIEPMCCNSRYLPKDFSQYKSNHVILLIKNITSIYQAEAILLKNKSILSDDSYTTSETAINSYKKNYLKLAQDQYKKLKQQEESNSTSRRPREWAYFEKIS